MRINNPKSIVGFQRSTNADELAYNLATVGQVKTAIADLREKIYLELEGAEGFGHNSGHGYAWLNGEGKVDITLLPALAITDTHVVQQSELKTLALNSASELNDISDAETRFSKIFDKWLKQQVSDNAKAFQQGDIIIVSVELGEQPDPVYAGSYILTEVPALLSNGSFQFSKLAYTDGNIVKVNGKAPGNSAGELRLYLSDILKERYIDKFNSTVNATTSVEDATNALESSVYRLVTLDEGNDGYRFAFIDDSDVGQGAVIPYTKLAEFDAEKTSTAERFTAVNEAIAALTAKHNTELSALTEKHDTELATLEEKHDTDIANLTQRHEEETNYISATIGKRTDGIDRELSATIFAQTKQLRKDVDDNLSAYLNTVDLTNQMLQQVQTNVNHLHQGLEKRAVRLYMQEFIWTADEAVLTEFDKSSAQYMYQVSAADVSGVVTWTHTHSPLGTGDNNIGDIDAENVQGISNIDSEERVLAVYDENNNLINVDMKFIKVGKYGLNDTQIIVETEFIGRDGTGKFKNSLEGKKWTMLLAKTISGIDINGVLVNVG